VALATIAQTVGERMGRSDLLRIADGSSEHPLVVASVNRLATEVGWRPRFTLTSAIDETVRWWTSPEAQAVPA
jgi:nucleoside-diphosphate-sugar epimerase